MPYSDVKYQVNRDERANVVNYTMKYNGERLGTTEKVKEGFAFTPYQDDGRLKPFTVRRMIDVRVALFDQIMKKRQVGGCQV